MKIIKRGAEAVLYKMDSQIIKDRIKKNYRIAELDNELRRQRTKLEARLLSEARRSGVATPQVFSVEENRIVMEHIEGERLKELINKTDEKSRKWIANHIGISVALLHNSEIIHGDLTTSNMILEGKKIYFIDFGLGSFSKRIEDFATDLSVLREALKSMHYKYLNSLWQNIIKAYKEKNPNADATLKQLEQIEKRGRYVERQKNIGAYEQGKVG